MSTKLLKMNTADRKEAWLSDIVMLQWISRIYGFKLHDTAFYPLLKLLEY